MRNVHSWIAASAVADRGPDRFLALNGLDRGANVRTGERYKVVAE